MIICSVYRNKFCMFVFCNEIMFTFVNQNMGKKAFFRGDTKMENTEMKDRIAHIIRAQNLTAAEFALRLGIQPSNVSHLLSGRNNPSLDFIKKLKETFPEYALDWIVMGVGPMTVSEPYVRIPTEESPSSFPSQEEKSLPEVADSIVAHQVETPDTRSLSSIHPNVNMIILVYEDQSFEVLSSR